MAKNYLITGAARGIGRGLTRHLVQKGHRVFLLDTNGPELEHTASQLRTWAPSSPPSAWQTHTCDLSDPATIQPAVDRASTFFNGHLDVLVNNAAFTSAVGGPHLTFPDFPGTWEKAVAVNLTAPVLLTRACVPLLRQASTRRAGGSVVMMSSTRAHQSEPDSEGYAATKAGLVGLTHALACSLAGDGVRVNAVLPGWINVAHECKEGDEKGLTWEDGITREDQRWHWAGRVGKVEDIVRAVEYLNEDGGFVTGTEMVVDGGVSRRMVYPE